MRSILIIAFLLCAVSLADYGWVPESESLILKLGWEYFSSENNFTPSGDKLELSSNGRPATLSENRFALDLEYGLSDVWAALFRTGYLSVAVTPSGGLGAGLFDTFAGFKWQANKANPVVALEGGMVFAPYSINNLDPDELAIGDGVSGVATRLHLGTKAKRFVFSVSPGLYFRFGRFSHQFIFEGAISRVFRKFFIRGFVNSKFSMTKNSPIGTLSENSEPGSGGSFSRLSVGPDLANVGMRIGWSFSRKFRLESFLQQSVWGKSSGDGFQTGLQLVSLVDFHIPDNREQISEVPLNSD